MSPTGEIKKNLPTRDQYLVSTAEFDDVKARLQATIGNRRKHEKPGPTLRKREAADTRSTAEAGFKGEGTDHGEDSTPDSVAAKLLASSKPWPAAS